jgi:hypothetical protein
MAGVMIVAQALLSHVDTPAMLMAAVSGLLGCLAYTAVVARPARQYLGALRFHTGDLR